VVTEADPAKRIVKEINGLPAAEEYARLVGVDVHELTPCFCGVARCGDDRRHGLCALYPESE